MRALNAAASRSRCGIRTTISQFRAVAKQPHDVVNLRGVCAVKRDKATQNQRFSVTFFEVTGVADHLLRSERPY